MGPTVRARVLLVALLPVVVGLLAAPGAAAGEIESSGWWWRPQSGLLGVSAPGPPNVPEEGLSVARDVEPLATAAVRAQLAPDEADPVLVLEVADAQNGAQAAILVCVTDVRWEPVRGGRWDDRPPAYCEDAVPGVRSEDGSTWRFEVAPLRVDDLLNVVLVPGPDAPPFQVAFAPPAPDSLRTRPSGDDGAATPGADAPADGDGAPADGATGSAQPDGEEDPPAPATAPPQGPARAGPPVSGTTAQPRATDSAPAPDVAPPGGASAPPADAGQAGPAAAGTATPAAPAARDAGPLGWLLLGAIAVSLLVYVAERLPPHLRVGPLAWVAGPAGPRERGLGRFAAERDGTPRPLL